MVPPFPAFSPAALAACLKVGRSTVSYWMHNGKLTYYRDNIGEPYILREEVLRFCREYLQRPYVESS